jgi:hypothetical protein
MLRAGNLRKRDLTAGFEHLLQRLRELHEEVARILRYGLAIATRVVKREGGCVAEDDEDSLGFLCHGAFAFLRSILGGVERHVVNERGIGKGIERILCSVVCFEASNEL